MTWNPPQNSNASSLIPAPAASAPATIITSTAPYFLSYVPVSNYQSYDLSFTLVDSSQATAGHPLTCQVIIAFYDDNTSGIPVYTEIWNPWVTTQASGGGNGLPVTGTVVASGPMHGSYMTISIKNTTTFGVTLGSFYLFGSPRTLQVSDWRQQTANLVVNNGWHNMATMDTGFELSLADTGVAALSLAASTKYWIPLNLFAGEASVAYSVSAAVTAMGITDMGSVPRVSGNNLVGGGQLLVFNLTAETLSAIYTFFPRGGCAFYVETDTACSFWIKIVGRQGT